MSLTTTVAVVTTSTANNDKSQLDQKGMTTNKETNFSAWYTELLSKCKLISYTDIGGCYVLLPTSYGIWEHVTKALNKQFKTLNIQNSYFPLFITRKQLNVEQDHVEGFMPEVAMVTHVGNHEIQDKDFHLAIRPTSECSIYPIYKTLIRSTKDLPLKFNQFCNVVRWEFKDTTPFIRSREFLWSETHNCFETEEEARADVDLMLHTYDKFVFQDLLAIPTILGTKTNMEKFNGSVSSRTIECIIPSNGRGVQAATCHYLGTIFSKAFGIEYRTKDNVLANVHQTCHGITTRTIGIMLMMHSDNKGLVLPPKVAAIQVVIIPIKSKDAASTELVHNYIAGIVADLRNKKVRVVVDDNQDETMGFKCNRHELNGVPIRLEIGLRDVQQGCFMMFRRDKLVKTKVARDDGKSVVDMLQEINDNLLSLANDKVCNTIAAVTDRKSFRNAIKDKKVCLINWCNTDACEGRIKNKNGVKSFCIVDESSGLGARIGSTLEAGTECMFCRQPATVRCLFGKSY